MCILAAGKKNLVQTKLIRKIVHKIAYLQTVVSIVSYNHEKDDSTWNSQLLAKTMNEFIEQID